QRTQGAQADIAGLLFFGLGAVGNYRRLLGDADQKLTPVGIGDLAQSCQRLLTNHRRHIGREGRGIEVSGLQSIHHALVLVRAHHPDCRQTAQRMLVSRPGGCQDFYIEVLLVGLAVLLGLFKALEGLGALPAVVALLEYGQRLRLSEWIHPEFGRENVFGAGGGASLESGQPRQRQEQGSQAEPANRLAGRVRLVASSFVIHGCLPRESLSQLAARDQPRFSSGPCRLGVVTKLADSKRNGRTGSGLIAAGLLGGKSKLARLSAWHRPSRR